MSAQKLTAQKSQGPQQGSLKSQRSSAQKLESLFRLDEDSSLSEREQKMLTVERQAWKYAGTKEQVIVDLFGLSATQYYQALNVLIDTQAALAFDPALIKRLRSARVSRV